MNNLKVKIKKICWLDKDNPEAEILFETNNVQLWAFSHPCYFLEEEITEVKLSFIEEEIPDYIFWNYNSEKEKKIIPLDNKLSYLCYGQIKQINPVLVDCGSIILSLEDDINDLSCENHYVYFVIARLDIVKIESNET